MKNTTKIYKRILSAMLSFLFVFMLFATVSVLPAVAVAGETSVMVNGEFDGSTSGWTFGGEGGWYDSGKAYIKNWGSISQTVTVEPNTKYYWTFQTANFGSDAANFTFSLGNLHSKSYVTPNGAWKAWDGYIETGDSTASLNILIYKSTGGDLYVNYVRLQKFLPDANRVTNGDFSEGTNGWTGDFNLRDNRAGFTSNSWGHAYQTILVEPNTYYSFYAQTANFSGSAASCNVSFGSAASTTISASTYNFGAGRYVFNSGDNNTLNLAFDNQGNSDFCFDNVEIKKLATDGNMLVNGDFTDGSTAWSEDPTIESGYLRFNGGEWKIVSQTFYAEPNTAYIWTMRAGSWYNDSSDADITVAGQTVRCSAPKNNYNWTTWSGSFTTTATGYQAFSIYNRGGTLRVDDIVVMKNPFAGHSLVLTDAVGVNFFMNLNGLTTAEKNSSYMTFEITKGDSDSAQGEQCDFTDIKAELKDDINGKYGFTCFVNSVQMAESITPTFHYGEGKTIVGSPYSVKDYIDYVTDNAATFNAQNEYIVPLVESIGNYGHYAQVYLGGLHDLTYTSLADSYASTYNSTTYDTYKASLKSPTDYEKTDVFGESGITKSQIKLNLYTSISVTIRLTGNPNIETLVKKNSSAYTGEVNRVKVSSYCLVDIMNLPISQLGDQLVITNDSGNYSVSFSGLSYVYSILNGTGSNNAKNAVCSIYDYYKAARDYQSSLS